MRWPRRTPRRSRRQVWAGRTTLPSSSPNARPNTLPRPRGGRCCDFQDATDYGDRLVAIHRTDLQTKGVRGALAIARRRTSLLIFQAMATAGYKPAFVILGCSSTTQLDAQGASPRSVPSRRSTSRRAGGLSRWLRKIPRPNSSSSRCTHTPRATQSTSTTRRAPRPGSSGRRTRSACGADLTVSCVLDPRRRDRRIGVREAFEAPVAQLTVSNANPHALTVLRPAEGRAEQVRLRQGDHPAYTVNLELQPQERRSLDRTTAGGLVRGFIRGVLVRRVLISLDR